MRSGGAKENITNPVLLCQSRPYTWHPGIRVCLSTPHENIWGSAQYSLMLKELLSEPCYPGGHNACFPKMLSRILWAPGKQILEPVRWRGSGIKWLPEGVATACQCLARYRVFQNNQIGLMRDSVLFLPLVLASKFQVRLFGKTPVIALLQRNWILARNQKMHKNI